MANHCSQFLNQFIFISGVFNMHSSDSIDLHNIYTCRDVMKNGLSQQITLENSYNYDSVLCACVADVDFDGLNEIILGTYGQVTNF